MNPIKSFSLDVEGLGIIFYSPFATASIAEGDDYLESQFFDPDLVAAQAVEGRIVGVSTGTPGRFLMNVYRGYPEEAVVEKHDFKLRLGIEVRDRMLCIRDLYDLMDWRSTCPPGQSIELDDGFYHVTLLSSEPASGVMGDNQLVGIYLQQLPEMPKLRYSGVPTLC